MYDVILSEFEKRSKPLDVIVVGLGFMGFGFVSFSRTLRGLRVPLLITRRPQESKTYLEERGFKVEVENNPGKIKTLADQGYICVSDNLDLIKSFDNSIVLEMTGTVSYGAEVAIRTLNAGKHLVTMNPELQVAVGTELAALASRKNLIVTDVIGDQPGSLSRLISQAKLMGFRVLLAGNMKRYLDVRATQKKMQPWADDKGLAVRQTTSFTDGTKQAIEMNLVANYFGMKIAKRGMLGPQVEDVKEVLKHFDWDKLPEEGIVDYVIGKNLFPGVFIVCEHRDPYQQKYLRYLGLGEGPRYVLFEPYHLCHLEIIQTIAKVAFFNQETINNSLTPIAMTFAVAKFNLKSGTKLDGIGGDSVYGIVDNIADCKGFLPIGLAEGAILKKNISQDKPIKIDDVILPENTATKLSGLVDLPQKPAVITKGLGLWHRLTQLI